MRWLTYEFWLKIYPLTLGGGKRLFVDGTIPAAFKVMESKVFPSGVILVKAKTVVVSVAVTCTEEVYDTAAAQMAGTSLLTTLAMQYLGSTYRLAGNVAVNVIGGYSGTPITLKTQGFGPMLSQRRA